MGAHVRLPLAVNSKSERKVGLLPQQGLEPATIGTLAHLDDHSAKSHPKTIPAMPVKLNFEIHPPKKKTLAHLNDHLVKSHPKTIQAIAVKLNIEIHPPHLPPPQKKRQENKMLALTVDERYSAWVGVA
jgi:hypothetical protein